MVTRRLFALLLCLVVILSACGPAAAVVSASPEVSGLPAMAVPMEPVASLTHDPFTIALLSWSSPGNDQEQARDKVWNEMLDRVQQYMNAQGWRVTLQFRRIKMPDDPAATMSAVRRDIASGGAADGYEVDKTMADNLLKQQLTQDVGPIARRCAPQLYEQLKYLRGSAVAGMPYYLQYWPKFRPTVLYLESDVLKAWGKPIANADDLLVFMEGGQRVEQSSTSNILDVWAAQQGCYALGPYGLPGCFYARTDDVTCMPVPLEKIPGFDAFFQRVRALELQGGLVSITQYPFSVQPCGYLGRLTRQMQLEFTNPGGKTGADFTVCPLQGCTAPSLDADDPDILDVIAVPAASPHGDAVVTFAQWGLASPDGYTLCNYGKRDVDYRVTEAGIEFLRDGKPLTADDWKLYETFSLPSVCMIRGQLFNSDNLERANIYEASNADALILQTQPVLPPIWRAAELRKRDARFSSTFDDLTAKYQDALGQRYEVLFGHAGTINAKYTVEQQLERLHEVEPQIEELCYELQERIEFLLKE